MKIEWIDKTEGSPWKAPTFYGMIGPLHVATIWLHESKWVVNIHLGPLPDNLDAMTWDSKASEQQARATGQRVINAFTKILNGEQS